VDERESGSPEDAAVESPWLLFEIDRRARALHLDDVAGVTECRALRALPGSPPGVEGLARWRGGVITVLASPRRPWTPTTPATPTAPTGACLVCLAGAWRGVAIRLDEPPRIGWTALAGDVGPLTCDGRTFERTAPGRLVSLLLGAGPF
jgi:chemotaxis signal transduction protein